MDEIKVLTSGLTNLFDPQISSGYYIDLSEDYYIDYITIWTIEYYYIDYIDLSEDTI